jgi:hypothetical protein
VDLGFDNHQVTILTRDLLGLISGEGDLAWWNRYAVFGKDLFSLILV